MYDLYRHLGWLAEDYGSAMRIYFAELPWLSSAVLAAFAAANSLRIIAYLPQLMRAANDTNGATAVSCTTWGLFFVSNLTTVAYGLIILGDLIIVLIFIGNSIACLAIVLITLIKRKRHRAVPIIRHASGTRPFGLVKSNFSGKVLTIRHRDDDEKKQVQGSESSRSPFASTNPIHWQSEFLEKGELSGIYGPNNLTDIPHMGQPSSRLPPSGAHCRVRRASGPPWGAVE